MSSTVSWLTNSALVHYMRQMRGGPELQGLSQRVQLYSGAQINFGDLSPYLTYGNYSVLKKEGRLSWFTILLRGGTFIGVRALLVKNN